MGNLVAGFMLKRVFLLEAMRRIDVFSETEYFIMQKEKDRNT
jgi:hypothetical protein